MGEKFGDISSIQVGREKWCLKCGLKAEKHGAGANGPAIAVWDEVQVPSVVEDMIEMDRVQDLRDQVQSAGILWVEDELRVKK